MTPDYVRDFPLASLNTFGLQATARQYVRVSDDSEVVQALDHARRHSLPVTLLGGGSNVLFSQDIEGLVLHMASRGVRLVSDDGVMVTVEVEAGEPWHPFVLQTLEMGFYGLENLSLIPGTVGAAPVQNIGAYGVEIKDVFSGLTALDRQSGKLVDFDAAACAFGYRESCFKQSLDRWIILRVRFRLSRQPSLRLEYGPIQQRLQLLGIDSPTPQDVSNAICAIRAEKLPDPKVLPNAGSFFKNPVISSEQAAALKASFPSAVLYPQAEGRVKLAAGWLIDQAGWRGYRKGDAGVHQHQALVLVNYGAASGAEILALARLIQDDIKRRFGVDLEIEPRII